MHNRESGGKMGCFQPSSQKQWVWSAPHTPQGNMRLAGAVPLLGFPACGDAVAWQPEFQSLENSNFSIASEVGAGQIVLTMQQRSVALLVKALRKISVADLKTAHTLLYFATSYLHYFLFIINQSSFAKYPESQPRILAKHCGEQKLPTSPPCSHGAKRWRSTLPLTTSLATTGTQRIFLPSCVYQL